MKIFEILAEQGPQAPVKPVASAVVNSPSAPAVPATTPATTPKKISVKQAQKEYDDIEDEEEGDYEGEDNPGSTMQKSNLNK